MSKTIQAVTIGMILAFVAAMMMGFIPAAEVDQGASATIILK